MDVNLVIFGPPGAGKGTYASRLAAELKIASIATGDIFRREIREKTDLGTRIADFVQKGLLVPDNIVIEALRRRISEPDSARGFVLDGYPRTIDQAEALERIVEVDGIVLLDVPEWVVVERLSNRRICRNCGAIYNVKYSPKPKVDLRCDKCGGEVYQREDDRAEVIKERLGVYERQTQPLIDYYRKRKTTFVKVENIEVDSPIDEVFKRIMDGLKRAKLI